ncbi:MAG TPA: TetR/AcrR family transcriptional regulator [Solirubrobacterales bacterium]|nr:TetR/AcrR family transcriptional regulator [Solirubrobacterales bacterium]
MSDSRPLSERLSALPSGRDLAPPPDLVAQSQRERILTAVADLAAEKGYRGMTIEAIAKRARVALSTFYEHFEDKEACFLAAFDESVAAARQVFAELVDRGRPWPEQIATGLEVLLDMVVAEPARAKLCLVEAQAAGTTALLRYQEALESVAPRLREGRDLNPRTARLPDGLEVAIAGGLAWLIHQRLAADRVDDLKALLPEMLQVTLTPYMGEMEAGRAAEEAEARLAA